MRCPVMSVMEDSAVVVAEIEAPQDVLVEVNDSGPSKCFKLRRKPAIGEGKRSARSYARDGGSDSRTSSDWGAI